MPDYRRSYIPGGTYFFTLVTYQRRNILSSPLSIEWLDIAISKVMAYHPFSIDAYCILPNHIHYVWTLHEKDCDYSTRIGLLKRYFTKLYSENFNAKEDLPESRIKRGELTIWQRRFWEHTILDVDDLSRHIDYIHYNPVKHGLIESARDWPYSSFLSYVENGVYDVEWGANNLSNLEETDFGE